MIISVSRRTDIPALYSDWFYNRIKEGYVMVRNPFCLNKISKISISPDIIDCIVFWTKNPKPMLKFNRFNELKDYNYYFQFSLTPYDRDIESNLPGKSELVDTFKELSEIVTPQRLIWRYDPILVSSTNPLYSVEYHINRFRELSEQLRGYFEIYIISFIDYYKKIKHAFDSGLINELEINQIERIAESFSYIAKKNGFTIKTCAEKYDLKHYGIEKASCVDKNLIEKITGKHFNNKVHKDPNQRAECGCIESIDIGTYNTCVNGCVYCYANIGKSSTMNAFSNFDVDSPILCSRIKENDIIKEREIISFLHS